MKLFLRKGSNVIYQILDLIGLQALPVRRHFAFTVRGDGGELGVAHVLDRRGGKILSLQRCLTLPISPMTGSTFGFVSFRGSLGISFRVRTEQNQTDKALRDQDHRQVVKPIFHVFSS
jgi:hypothetical protein